MISSLEAVPRTVRSGSHSFGELGVPRLAKYVDVNLLRQH